MDTAWANKIQSDRFFNPNNMVCPVWNGMDSAGRKVCPDSYVTKTAGCNSAEDRVLVENDQRPQYMEYINLSANGFSSDIYKNSLNHKQLVEADANIKSTDALHGSFGQQFKATNYPGCSYNSYRETQGRESYDNRRRQALQNGFYANQNRKRSGF